MKPLLLVVDDDIDDIEFVKDAVQQIPDPPDVHYFLNGESLLKFLRHSKTVLLPPMIITLDINLPGINGIDLLKIIKHDLGLSGTPVSMVTTSSSIEHKKECMKHGARHFFTKPVNISEWIGILESITLGVKG